jgi:Shikimate kinase
MKRIYLIGYMGAGKTTLGQLLAPELGFLFIDLDHAIENRYSRTVGELFSEKGEAGFREIERDVLREVSQTENVVISTGGGAPLFYDNMDFMNREGLTVYLKVSPEELVSRLKTEQEKRPLIRGKSEEELTAFISESLSKREGVYALSKLTFLAENLSSEKEIQQMVTNLLNRCKRYGKD